MFLIDSPWSVTGSSPSSRSDNVVISTLVAIFLFFAPLEFESSAGGERKKHPFYCDEYQTYQLNGYGCLTTRHVKVFVFRFCMFPNVVVLKNLMTNCATNFKVHSLCHKEHITSKYSQIATFLERVLLSDFQIGDDCQFT